METTIKAQVINLYIPYNASNNPIEIQSEVTKKITNLHYMLPP